MTETPVPADARRDARKPFVLRWLKRIVLGTVGPVYFLFIAFVPLLLSGRAGFRGWYWRVLRRACSRLLWLLSIETRISDDDRRTLGADTNSIIVINHRSHLDGFALMDVVPDEKWITFAAKKELCRAPLLRAGFTAAGLVEIDRESGKRAMQSLIDAIRAMPSRLSLVLFPEGTRARSETLDDFKAGAVVAARATGRAIRPIVLRGTDRLMARGQRIPGHGSIDIEVLPLFQCDLDSSVEDDLHRLRASMVQVFHSP